MTHQWVSHWNGHIQFKLAYLNLAEISQGRVLQIIQKAIDDGTVTLQDLATKKLIFDSLHEGHGQPEFQAVLTDLQDAEWFHINRTVFLNNVADEIQPPINSVSWPWRMVDHCNWLEHVKDIAISHIKKDCGFVCLMRRRSPLRSLLCKNIRQRYPNQNFRLSYASMIDYQAYDTIAEVDLPILLDGPTPDLQQHRASDHAIFSCAINLIVETSNQEPSTEHTWRSKFITEKTFKCFAWLQVPIWFTVPNFVPQVRNLGFDVFDDIMQNHNYDSIDEPELRMYRMLDVLDMALNHIKDRGFDQFQQSIQHRLQHNAQVLQALYDRKPFDWEEIIKRVNHI